MNTPPMTVNNTKIKKIVIMRPHESEHRSTADFSRAFAENLRLHGLEVKEIEIVGTMAHGKTIRKALGEKVNNPETEYNYARYINYSLWIEDFARRIDSAHKVLSKGEDTLYLELHSSMQFPDRDRPIHINYIREQGVEYIPNTTDVMIGTMTFDIIGGYNLLKRCVTGENLSKAKKLVDSSYAKLQEILKKKGIVWVLELPAIIVDLPNNHELYSFYYEGGIIPQKEPSGCRTFNYKYEQFELSHCAQIHEKIELPPSQIAYVTNYFLEYVNAPRLAKQS